MPTKLTNYERETIINFNEGEDTMSVYTHSPKLRRRLEQLAQERPEECRPHRVTHWGEAVEYHVPKSWLKIHPPRQIGEAQRKALEKARQARKTLGRPAVGEGPATETGKDTSQGLDGEKEG